MDNFAEDIFVAKRINCDHVTSVGGLQNIDASDKHLLLAASLARQNYSSDEYAEKAEQTHQVSWITKSNSFRRSAKEKSAEATAVEEQLKQKLHELKSNEWSRVGQPVAKYL